MKSFLEWSVGFAVLLLWCGLLCWLWLRRETPVSVSAGRKGQASWYGEGYRGKTMANGKPFDPEAMTCASWDYPLGTLLRVRHVESGRYVIVEVTDRGPAHWTKCTIDLSARAFRRLAAPTRGIIAVDVVTLEGGK